jgi:transportin-3
VAGVDKPTPALVACLNSWLREISCSDVVKTPLVDSLFAAFQSDIAFDEAVDCVCTMFRETREVDESAAVIEVLYPRLIALRPKINEAAEAEDVDTYKGVTRLFAEAGEAWAVLIARMPAQFRALVEGIEECAQKDTGRDVISLTFNFWYELKNYLVLEHYMDARMHYADVYGRLVEIMINHLQYPKGDGDDLFDGDREYEEKFREFRHAMGDVLKDCCEVIGSADCLKKAFEQVKAWMEDYAKQTPDNRVKCANWQKLEAPLFSLRAMGRMVPTEEDVILPQIMQLLIQLPEHEKVRFAATLVLGRYTEWTAKHPEYLQPQMNYITNGFQHGSKDVAQAAAMALKFFCQDCGKLLVDNIAQLHQFYESVSPNLPLSSLYEITDGVAHVVASQPLDKVYDSLYLFCSPIAARLMEKANAATDNGKKCKLADEIQLLTIFVQVVHPHVPEGQDNPMIRFWQSIVPVLSTILDGFVDFLPICEQVGRFYRSMLISYRTAMLPLLPQVAHKLTTSFEKSHQGIFLWVSGTVIREFGDEEFTDEQTRNSVVEFLNQQCLSMFRLLNNTHPKEIPDGLFSTAILLLG